MRQALISGYDLGGIRNEKTLNGVVLLLFNSLPSRGSSLLLERVKKLGSVFLLLMMITPFWVVFFSLHAKKEIVRREVKHRLMESEPDESFVHLSFTKEETETLLRWEHEGEFEYQGEMYDLVHTETRNDSVFYTLWWDHDETELNRKLAALTKTRQSESAPPQERQLIDGFKVYPPTPFCETPRFLAQNEKRRYHHPESFSSVYPTVDSPPPEHRFTS